MAGKVLVNSSKNVKKKRNLKEKNQKKNDYNH